MPVSARAENTTKQHSEVYRCSIYSIKDLLGLSELFLLFTKKIGRQVFIDAI